jgi:hypothetical protein
MWCQDSFATFNQQLMLDGARAERIAGAVKRFTEFTEADQELRTARAGEPFLQGSVPSRTVIRPLARDDFDVDLVYPFRLSLFRPEHQRPLPVFDWFVSRLQGSEFYQNRLTRKNRCVRIDYAGDFHLDLIPATGDVLEHRPFAVPARDLSDWITNDPIGFTEWVRALDARSGLRDSSGDGAFVRSVRIMKRWRDHRFGEESAVSSILLVTMLGRHEASHKGYTPPLTDSFYPRYQYDGAYLYDLLRLTHSCLSGTPPRHAFEHPTISGEDLARGWDRAYLDLFLGRLNGTIDDLRRAIEAQDESTAASLYSKALGDSFPAG